jgi:uncharacterized membrane protein
LDQGRQAYLDRVRGLAVLVMVEAHVLDGWTRVAERQRPGFIYAMILGGFGAPLFLFLAGVSLVLSAESKFRKTGDLGGSWRAVQKRGWQIFGFAFLFRLQSFILTGGYSAIGLLKVDILNIMGPAIAFAGLAGERVKTRAGRAVLFGALSIATAMLTPIVRLTPALDWLPDPVEWYFRPSPTRTNFTLPAPLWACWWTGCAAPNTCCARKWAWRPQASRWQAGPMPRRSCPRSTSDPSSGRARLRFSFSASDS